ncbi:TraC family protein|nr:TraC family protein [Stenotrophomonas sp. SbOxS2]
MPWPDQTRCTRLVVYRRAGQSSVRRDRSLEQPLTVVCDRLVGGLANAGVKAHRLHAAYFHEWLSRSVNPHGAWAAGRGRVQHEGEPGGSLSSTTALAFRSLPGCCTRSPACCCRRCSPRSR